MTTVYLGLGSNVNARINIAAGITALREAFTNVRLSPAYRTAAIGFDGDDFINLSAAIETSLQPIELKHFLNDLEDRYGRLRNVPKFSDRTLDIDILLYDDLFLLSPQLQIPRREIMVFAHVLKPLADLAPDLVHPVYRKPLSEIWRDYSGDRTGLRPIEL
jgi:2-amino-4-hydroxy-6-hydroxymethyldihydropteridine diphosphokinase